jgi:hypothetical protein
LLTLLVTGNLFGQAPKTNPPPPSAASLVSLAPPATATNFWAAQIRSSKRIVSARTIDIVPLVRWHQRAGEGARPLTAWLLVTGRLAGQTAYGWKVTGHLDNEPQARPFIIKNPPLESLNEFNRLKAQFNQLLQRQTRLNADLATAQYLYEQTDANYKRFGYVRYGGDLLDQRLDQVNRIKASIARLDADIREFDTLGQDLRGEFTVRCFAVKTGQALTGMLVYDHGYVIR